MWLAGARSVGSGEGGTMKLREYLDQNLKDKIIAKEKAELISSIHSRILGAAVDILRGLDIEVSNQRVRALLMAVARNEVLPNGIPAQAEKKATETYNGRVRKAQQVLREE